MGGAIVEEWGVGGWGNSRGMKSGWGNSPLWLVAVQM